MGAVTQRSPLSRRTFLRVLGNASGAALASSLLGACGGWPTASGGQVVNLLWSDTTNARTPLLEDFTKATGIKVNQTIVQYNELLNKINTAVHGGGDFDVVEMDTIWTAQFASAGWVDDLTDRDHRRDQEGCARVGAQRGDLPGQAVWHAAGSTAPSTCSTTPSCSRMPASTNRPPRSTSLWRRPRPPPSPASGAQSGRWKQAEGADLRLGRDHVHPEGRADPGSQRQGGLQHHGRHRGAPVDGRSAVHAQGRRPGLAGVRPRTMCSKPARPAPSP